MRAVKRLTCAGMSQTMSVPDLMMAGELRGVRGASIPQPGHAQGSRNWAKRCMRMHRVRAMRSQQCHRS